MSNKTVQEDIALNQKKIRRRLSGGFALANKEKINPHKTYKGKRCQRELKQESFLVVNEGKTLY